MRGFRKAGSAALLVILTLLLLAGGAAADGAPRMQRMLIGAGCYRLAGHASGPVPAYCLDQEGSAPRRGVMLGNTPALGHATVSIDGETMSLAAALGRHVLSVEGTDTPDQLTLVNTTGKPLSLCVDRPVVVMGNGVDDSHDLGRIYDRIEALMSDDRAIEADGQTERHDRLQRRLWSMVKAIDDQEWNSSFRLGGPSAPPDGDDCRAGAAEIVLCR